MTTETDFFEKRDPWGHAAALWVLVAMVALIPPAWSSVRQIDLENDVENWLPAGDPEARLLDWYRDNFEIQDRLLVSWQGSSLHDPRVQRLADRLTGTPDEQGIRRNGVKLVKSVVTPHDVIGRMVEHGVDREEAIKRLAGTLIGTGLLKVRLTETGRYRKQQTIRSLIKETKSQYNIDVDVVEPAQPEDETVYVVDEQIDAEGMDNGEPNFEVAAAGEDAADDRPYDFEIGWSTMHVKPHEAIRVKQLVLGLRGRRNSETPQGEPLVAEVFHAPGSPVALSVALSEPGSAEPAAAFQAIRRAAQDVGIDPDQIRMGGRSVAASALNQEVKKAGWNRSVPMLLLHRRSVLLTSILVGIAVAFVMLRSVRLTVLVLVVAVYTMFLAVALVPATNGSMNMVLVVMPTLLSVLTISAGIHVANYWKHAARANIHTAVVDATKMARLPCTLASLTTAIGLVSLATSPLAPVRGFGLYSAVGCLILLIVVLYGLPSLLQLWPSRAPTVSPTDGQHWQHYANLLTRHRRKVTAACLALFVTCAYGFSWFRTETKVIRYFPEHSRLVQDYEFLERNLAGVVPVDAVIRFDADARHSLNFVQRLELVREIEKRMRAHPEISGAISLADFQPTAELPDENATFLTKARFNRTAHEIERRIKSGETGRSKSFLTVATEPAEIEASTGRLLSRPGDEFWRISAQTAILSDFDYSRLTRDIDNIAQAVLKYHAGADHFVTGMVPFFLRTQQAVLDSLISSFCLAFVVIAIIMMILLKNPLAGLLTMLPNLLPIGTVFGLIAWFGMPVDMGTMITASVALGIAVDGTLHLLTWFKSGLAIGLSRDTAVARALVHCGPAMWQTSVAVGLGLVMLSPADLLLVSRFGWLMAALIGAALIADVVFLPVLLAGPLGRLIEKSSADSASAPTGEIDLERWRLHQGSEAKPKLKVVTSSPSGQIVRFD